MRSLLAHSIKSVIKVSKHPVYLTFDRWILNRLFLEATGNLLFWFYFELINESFEERKKSLIGILVFFLCLKTKSFILLVLFSNYKVWFSIFNVITCNSFNHGILYNYRFTTISDFKHAFMLFSSEYFYCYWESWVALCWMFFLSISFYER